MVAFFRWFLPFRTPPESRQGRRIPPIEHRDLSAQESMLWLAPAMHLSPGQKFQRKNTPPATPAADSRELSAGKGRAGSLATVRSRRKGFYGSSCCREDGGTPQGKSCTERRGSPRSARKSQSPGLLACCLPQVALLPDWAAEYGVLWALFPARGKCYTQPVNPGRT